MKDAGYSAKELKGAGYSSQELKEAGFTEIIIKIVEEIKDPVDLRNTVYPYDELCRAGFTIGELLDAGYRPEINQMEIERMLSKLHPRPHKKNYRP